MKYFLIILLHFFSFSVYSQKFPDKLVDRPDGITITYFDYSDQNNKISSELFLGNTVKFKFYEYGIYNRTDVSKKKVEIETIEKYVTTALVKNILNCCSRKKCPDTIKGYCFMVKKGTVIDYAYLDYKFLTAELCGSEDINKIINSFNKI